MTTTPTETALGQAILNTDRRQPPHLIKTMTIINADVLKNIPEWQHLEWTGERFAACASDELFQIEDKVTDRGSYLAALLKIVDNTDLLLEFYNGAVEGNEQAVVSSEYLEGFILKHGLLDRLYSSDLDPEEIEDLEEWDWFDWKVMGARLVPMKIYNATIEQFIKTLPALNEYWEHLVDAHQFLASSKGPTARKEVFNIFVEGNLKKSGQLQEVGVIAPRCLDLKTGKIYATA